MLHTSLHSSAYFCHYKSCFFDLSFDRLTIKNTHIKHINIKENHKKIRSRKSNRNIAGVHRNGIPNGYLDASMGQYFHSIFYLLNSFDGLEIFENTAKVQHRQCSESNQVFLHFVLLFSKLTELRFTLRKIDFTVNFIKFHELIFSPWTPSEGNWTAFQQGASTWFSSRHFHLCLTFECSFHSSYFLPFSSHVHL